VAPLLGAATAPDPAGALDRAIEAAEVSLKKGDIPAAEKHYREALFAGWMLRTTLARLEGRDAEARGALAQAVAAEPERREDLRSLAVGALEAGETERALEILRDLVASGPRDIEARRLLARALAGAGRVDEAVRALDEASARAAADSEMTYLLGADYLALKKADAAERLFARVVAARPIPETHVLIGRTYRDAGEYEKARAHLRAALRQDPKARRAHYYLGMTLLADAAGGPERLEKAIAEFRQELKLAPGDALTNDQLGLALLEAGRPAEAVPPLEAAVRAEPRSLYAYHLGRGQLALARPADAAASWRRALAMAEEQAAGASELERIHYQLGVVLRRLGAENEAAGHLAEAKRLSSSGAPESTAEGPGPGRRSEDDARGAGNEAYRPFDLSRTARQELARRATAAIARSYLNLGVIAARGERFPDAVALLEKAAAVDPDFPQLQYSLGVAYFNARRFGEAAGPLARSLPSRPGDVGLRRMLGMAWLNVQAYDKAAELLGQDPELTTDPALQFAYGLALVKSDRVAEAQRVFSLLLTRHGDSAELGVLLGMAHAQSGDYDKAIEAFHHALELKADVSEANGALGAIYLKQGRLEEAEAALRAELKTQPGSLQAQQNLAVALEQLQRPQEAVPLLKGVLLAKPDSADARYLLGKILLAQGSAAEAAQHLAAAAKAAPEDANIHYQLARAYQALGRSELAEQELAVYRQMKEKRRETPSGEKP
jgi:tetratricopeptide (TPR) repeat protein